MFSAEGLRAIIRTTMLEIDLWSADVEELILGTAAKESRLGYWLKQLGGGPGRGIFQIELKNEIDIWDNFLNAPFRADLKKKFVAVTGVAGPDEQQLTYNPVYGAALARCHYRRIADPIPPAHDIFAQAEYWNNHYNRNPDYGFPEEYVTNYLELVLGAKEALTKKLRRRGGTGKL